MNGHIAYAFSTIVQLDGNVTLILRSNTDTQIPQGFCLIGGQADLPALVRLGSARRTLFNR
jgi:hypothetical protein